MARLGKIVRIPRFLHDFWQWAKEPLLVLVLVGSATTALAQPFYVPSGSMEPTLQIGDGILGAKYPYGYSRYSLPFAVGPHAEQRLLGNAPKRGDVVVFRLPRDPSVTYVKRLIGLPGDRVQMVHGMLVINGAVLPRKPAGDAAMEDEAGGAVAATRYVETLPGGVDHPILKLAAEGPLDNTPVFVVPQNHYFMMGDNRDDSLDSRVAEADGGVGYVPAENLVARGAVVIGSYDFLNAHPVWKWLSAIRSDRFFHLL